MATLTSIAYARTRVRRGRTGQRVRLSATVTAVIGGGPFNLTARQLGHFSRVSHRLGGPYYAHANYPTPPFEHDTLIAGAAMCTETRFAFDSKRRILLICNDNGVITERASDDDGYSFNLSDVRFASGSHPDISVDRQGMILRACYLAGALKITRQAPGDTSPSAAFNAKDTAGVDLSLTDSVFRLVYAPSNWLHLHCRLGAGAATTLMHSHDDAASFAISSGAVTGITSGTHPGMTAGDDGALWAYARLADGTGRITVRHSGDTSWATPVAMVDSASASLLFADQPFSIAAAHEGPARLVLSAIIAGESLVSEHWSADPSGVSWTRFS